MNNQQKYAVMILEAAEEALSGTFLKIGHTFNETDGTCVVIHSLGKAVHTIPMSGHSPDSMWSEVNSLIKGV